MRTLGISLAAFALGIISREVVEKFLRYRSKFAVFDPVFTRLSWWRTLQFHLRLFWEA